MAVTAAVRCMSGAGAACLPQRVSGSASGGHIHGLPGRLRSRGRPGGAEGWMRREGNIEAGSRSRGCPPAPAGSGFPAGLPHSPGPRSGPHGANRIREGAGRNPFSCGFTPATEAGCRGWRRFTAHAQRSGRRKCRGSRPKRGGAMPLPRWRAPAWGWWHSRPEHGKATAGRKMLSRSSPGRTGRPRFRFRHGGPTDPHTGGGNSRGQGKGVPVAALSRNDKGRCIPSPPAVPGDPMAGAHHGGPSRAHQPCRPAMAVAD